MTLPNFLVIGKAKSGTTALYAALKSHPQIFMSKMKEPSFFTFENQIPNFTGPQDDSYNRNIISRLSDYQLLFEAVAGEKAIGEASTIYLSWYQIEKTVANIQRYLPKARLIAILRQPAEQAYSIFNFRRQLGREPLADFSQALAEENSPQRANWSPGCRYFRNVCYYSQLKHYFEHFPRQQMRIYLYEEWNQNPENVLRDLEAFLELESFDTVGSVERHNITRVPRSAKLNDLLIRPNFIKTLLKGVVPLRLRSEITLALKNANFVPPPPLSDEIRRAFTLACRDEILRLQDLLGRDLSHWLTL